MNYEEMMMKSVEIIQKVTEKIKDFDRVTFGSVIAMITEEWCARNNEDVSEFFGQMSEIASDVKEALGEYEPVF